MRSPPSAAAAAVVLVVVMGLERERRGGWMLKIHCVCSHINRLSSAIMAFTAIHPRISLDLKMGCFRFVSEGSLLRRQQEAGS